MHLSLFRCQEIEGDGNSNSNLLPSKSVHKASEIKVAILTGIKEEVALSLC